MVLQKFFVYLLKIGLWTVPCFGLWFAIVLSFDRISENAEDSQFYGDKTTYPNQPFNTYTNLMYCFNAAVALSMVRARHWDFYFPYINVALWGEAMGINSGLFHASTGYGRTGSLDVATIAPFALSILYLVVYTFGIAWKYHRHKRDFYIGYTRSFDRRLGGCCWFLPHTIIFGIEVVLFYVYFEDKIDIDWETQFQIFGSLIGVLSIAATVMVLYTGWKWLNENTQNGTSFNTALHIFILATSVVFLGATISSLAPHEETEHGSVYHLLLGGIPTIMTFFTRSTFVAINLNLKTRQNY